MKPVEPCSDGELGNDSLWLFSQLVGFLIAQLDTNDNSVTFFGFILLLAKS